MAQRTRETEHAWVRRARAVGRPLVFAHRGGAGLAPENTWPAFEHAHALGVDGFELDVRLSRDGEVVVIHDPDLGRTTNAQGRVSALSYDELSRADAGYRFSIEDTFPFRGRGVRIPKLRDLLVAFRDELFIIEVKDALVNASLLELIHAADAFERVCVGGFSTRTMWALRKSARARRYPEICTSASREETRWSLYASWVHSPLFWLGDHKRFWRELTWVDYQAFQVPEMAGRTRVVSPQFLKTAHDAGLLVQVWTVNEEADMRRLIDMGVDGLITDRPDLARQVLPIAPHAAASAAAAASHQ